ncbi:hypothetical protein OC834_000602 [Tilletia horrida]|nr:hypothetical protein OC834_000602 [Tilletia horrida]
MELLLTSDATTVILDPRGPNVIHAQVHLVIPRGTQPPAARLHSIRVSLQCKESLSFPGGWFETHQWEPSIDIEDVGDFRLQSGGTYSWEVQLAIPDDMPSYERCRSGFCFQTLRAEATFEGFRFFRKTLQAEKSIFLVPEPESDECFCYSHSQTGLAESLGPVAIHTESQHLTIGGYIRTAAQVPAPSPDCSLDAVEFTLTQNTKLKSRQRKGRETDGAPKRIRLLRAEGKDCEAMQWMIRLPSDMEVRPSTIAKQNSLQLTHNLEVRFYYSIDDSDRESTSSSSSSSTSSTAQRKRKAYLLSWPIHLPSCAFRWGTTHLPAYSPHDPCPVPARGRDEWTGKNEHLSQDQCVCGQTMEEVLEVEREMARVHSCGIGEGFDWARADVTVPEKQAGHKV